MKRAFILIFIAILACPLFADEAVLIDFSLLTADGDDGQNTRTRMDYSHVAGNSFTGPQKAAMVTSLAIENWEVDLASSARNVTNMGNSYTKESASREYGTVMGVRVHFPVEPHNSWAHIRPPFEIPAYEKMNDGDTPTTPSRFERQTNDEPAYGVVKNVGAIKSVVVRYYGLLFPHSLTVVLINPDGSKRNIFMGYLNQFGIDGWNELTWNNPAYVQEVRNRDIRLFPLYPYTTPFIKFGGFIVQRDAAALGGDFICYFKDVRLVYDKAVFIPEEGPDIIDEDVWAIIDTRETARKVWEMERFGQDQVLRYLEQQKQAPELNFNDPARTQGNQDK